MEDKCIGCGVFDGERCNVDGDAPKPCEPVIVSKKSEKSKKEKE